ncbi:acetyl-CoA C-acetyltransferase [Achromobacter xylosoxidans]
MPSLSFPSPARPWAACWAACPAWPRTNSARSPSRRRRARRHQTRAGRRSHHGQRAAGRPGPAPARQAALGAGLPLGVACTTIHKVCGSGLKAAMFGHDLLASGSATIVVAGGQESMSNAPYLMLKGRQGYRYGHSTVYDHMALDGLEDAYDKGKAMGVFAEDCASKYSFTREQQDAFSLESLRRARAASEDGSFKWEIAPVTVAYRKGDTVIDTDEAPTKAMPEKIPTLKPAFKKDGTVTAANSSSISDGAAAMVLMRASTAEKLGVKPLARIVAHSQHSQEPNWFTTAPWAR